MKLGDGRKVTMHTTPACAERSELHTRASELLSEWLASKDEATQMTRHDPANAAKLEEVRLKHKRLKAANAKVAVHTDSHGCW